MELYFYTDYACPFCYIARRHAAEFKRRTGAELIPRYVEIHPEVPPQGCGRGLLLDDAQNRRMSDFLAELGAPYELAPSLGERLSNSEKAITVRGWVSLYAPEKLEVLDEAVCRAYCIEHRDIGRDEVLRALLAEVGIDTPPETMLTNSRAKSIYENDRFRARQERIRAVPSFRIGTELLPGLQTLEKLVELYTRQVDASQP